MNPPEKTVVDERCYCGCLKSEHDCTNSTKYSFCRKCGCPGFVWFGLVFSDGSEIWSCQMGMKHEP